MSDLPLIIIPAAGSSKRFKDVGIDTPKGLIALDYNFRGVRSMISTISNNYIEVLVVSNDLQFDTAYGKEDWQLQLITESKGQADTVRQACETIEDQPVIIMNCDALVKYPLNIFYEQCKWANIGALVFDGGGNTAYSYVDELPLFAYAAEKKVVSQWAMAGVYYFKSCKDLVKAITNQMKYATPHPEYYLSGTMEYIEGPRLAIPMDRSKFRNWGTPEELARDPLVKVVNPKIEAILKTLR